MRLSNKPLISAEAIQSRVAALAEAITADYARRTPVLVGVLKGAVHLTSDLARCMPGPLELEFVRASSYENTSSSGRVRISGDHLASLSGRDILLVEDILDTGRTLSAIVAHLQALAPASLRICTLLDKPSRRVVPVTPDYVGFTIEDHFVVGYGLDYNERYRELHAIHVLEEDGMDCAG